MLRPRCDFGDNGACGADRGDYSTALLDAAEMEAVETTYVPKGIGAAHADICEGACTAGSVDWRFRRSYCRGALATPGRSRRPV